jgi:membrane protein implicated in regulation of membrane protease activity
MRAREANLHRVAAAAIDAEHEAVVAAGFVGLFVAIPAVAAAGAVFALFALTSAVLLAPAVALTLTWVAWRYGRPAARRTVDGAAPRPASDGEPPRAA